MKSEPPNMQDILSLNPKLSSGSCRLNIKPKAYGPKNLVGANMNLPDTHWRREYL